ncbi:MAG: magnesium transporter [Oscillospiraceae bacterium]|nr:magnesium transporter [Oscillospiraceae bacterium]
MKLYFDLEKLIDERRFNFIRDGLEDVEPADIAGMVEELPPEKAVVFFRILPKDMEAEVFANLDHDMQKSLIERFSDKEICEVIEELFLDDAVDFIEEMPAAIAKRVLAHATDETREQINKLLQYPDDSAGTIMTVEFVHLKRTLTVAEAFTKIRKIGPDKETIYTCYITDAERKIEGVVSVKNLLLAEPTEILGDIMETHMILVHTDDDREKVVKLFEKYDFLSMPVVDSEDRIVGIITIDDIIDVVQDEATEDMQKMAGMLASDKPYFKTSILGLTKNRIVWLVVLMVVAMIIGGILENFEGAIAALPILTVFIPLLMDTGGSSGSQSATMIIRGMALGEITPRDFFRIIWKEMRTGLLVGSILAIINFGRMWLTYMNHPEHGPNVIPIAMTVSITLLITVFIANVVGGLLPIAAKKLKIDPAVMAAPLITTIVDGFALIIYFSLAVWILGDLMATAA